MKKIIRTLLLATLLCCMLSVSALAAEGSISVAVLDAVGQIEAVLLQNGEAIYTVQSDSATVNFKSVAPGSYDLQIKSDGCLPLVIQSVDVEDGLVNLGFWSLFAGDVNGDGKINIADMGLFRANFGKSGAEIIEPSTDIDGDGKVNIADMGAFRKNFGKTAEKDATFLYFRAGLDADEVLYVPEIEDLMIEEKGYRINVFTSSGKVEILVKELPEKGFYTWKVDENEVYDLKPVDALVEVLAVEDGKALTLEGLEESYQLSKFAQMVKMGRGDSADLSSIQKALAQGDTVRAVYNEPKNEVIWVLIES